MNDNKQNILYSWPVIIIALIIFWPLGLFLIIKRVSSDKTAMVNSSGKGMKIIGIALIAIGVLGIIGSLDSFDFGSIVIGLFFIAGGVVLMKKAKKIKTDGESIKKYLAIIVNGGVRELDTIAATTGKQYDVVKKDIQNMIDKGFLKNAYINENTREVVLATAAPANVNLIGQPAANTASSAAPRVVACPCCGANNTVTGALGECEYCGTPLK